MGRLGHVVGIILAAALAIVRNAEGFCPVLAGGPSSMGYCGGRAGACGRMRTLGTFCPQKLALSRSIVLSSRSGERAGSIGTVGLAMSGAKGKGGEEGGDARGAAEEAPVKLEGKSVGIDLGTSNSAVAAIVDGKPTIIPNSLGKRTTPSVVALVPREGGSEDDFDIVVGEAALAMDGQKNVFSSVKRVIGRSFEEARKIATGSLHRALFDEFGEDLQLRAPILKGTVKPEEVSSNVVKQLIKDAERHLGEKVTRAVITVPAYFTDKQREATEAAGMLAGLEKVKLLREPEAAALAYGLDKLEDELILVFDLGGGTLDVSVLEVGGGIIEVIWTGGDSQLGGDDFDKEMSFWLANVFVGEYGGSVSRLLGDRETGGRVMSAARDLKVRLSSSKTTNVTIGNLERGLDLETTVTQKQLEVKCRSLLERLAIPIRQVAVMAGIQLDGEMMGPPDDDEVDIFGEKKEMDVKAMKKAQQAGKARARMKNKRREVMGKVQKQMSKKMGKLREFPPGSELTEVVFVGGATRMPAVVRTVRAITGIEPRKTIDPEEAVALGAAVQAGMMDGDVQGLEVLSPLQAALLRGFARKRLKEQKGTYKPLMGDPESADEDKDIDWDNETDDEEWDDDEEWLGSEDIAALSEEITNPQP